MSDGHTGWGINCVRYGVVRPDPKGFLGPSGCLTNQEQADILDP